MAVRLFPLRGVPEDEAEEIRALLESNAIPFHETSAGTWGISSPAIWLKNEGDLAAARALIDDYQRQRFATQRAQYEALKREGRHRTVRDVIKDNPVRFVLYLAVVALVLYLSIKPFLFLGK